MAMAKISAAALCGRIGAKMAAWLAALSNAKKRQRNGSWRQRKAAKAKMKA